jgi:hypothetical protein
MFSGMTSVSTTVGADQVPEAVRSRTTFTEADYVDVYVAATPMPAPAAGSAEEWARAILERAAVSKRHARRFWRALGLRLGPPGSPDHVQGWRITARDDRWVRFETGSWYMRAQAVVLVDEDQVSLSLSLRYRNPVARLVMVFVAGPHQRAVPVMLHQAVQLMTPTPPATDTPTAAAAG